MTKRAEKNFELTQEFVSEEIYEYLASNVCEFLNDIVHCKTDRAVGTMCEL